MKLFSSASLPSRLAVTDLGFLEQKLKLRAVIPDRLQPFGQLEMTQVDAAAAADGEVFLVEVGVLKLVWSQRVVVEVRIVIEVLLESDDAFLQPIDLVDGAL